ncbi:MAG: 7TMR-DISM family protein [Marinobacter sp.]|uniref:7TMR-DISM family protein n=1 Tax=Marinobacter sp. TaxID=50741 RepID=UPI003C31BD13
MQQWQSLTRRSVLAILVLLAWALPGLVSASAQCQDDHIVLNSATTSVRDLGSCIWYLEDPDHSLGFNDVVEEADHSFTRHNGGVLNFGYTESAYWARFDLRVGAGAALSDWILELALPLVDEVVLYVVQDGELLEQRRAGYEGDWSSRDLAVPNPTFRLSLETGAPVRIYLRITNTNTFRLPITLWHPDSYIEKVSVDEVVRGILLGSILAIFAYNLFVAVSVRERSNIYYVLYLISAVVFIATEQVHGTQLFDDRPAFLNKEYLHFQILTTWFWGLLMARSLLETRQRAPDLDQVIRLCLYSVVLTFVLSLFLPYHVAMEWIVLGSIVLSALMILVSYLSWRYYNPAARSYFFAWTLALVGFGIYALTVMGYLPVNMFTSYSPQFGLTGQIILFSFALADRIKQVQGEALRWLTCAATSRCSTTPSRGFSRCPWTGVLSPQTRPWRS